MLGIHADKELRMTAPEPIPRKPEPEYMDDPAEAAAYARRRMGLTVHVGRLTEIDLPTASFDVVTMWNVLEHLHDPLTNLRAVGELLGPRPRVRPQPDEHSPGKLLHSGEAHELLKLLTRRGEEQDRAAGDAESVDEPVDAPDIPGLASMPG